MAREKPIITSWDDVPVIFDIPFFIRLFGVSRPTALKLISKGELRASKIADSWRIKKSDALAWFDSCSFGGAKK